MTFQDSTDPPQEPRVVIRTRQISLEQELDNLVRYLAFHLSVSKNDLIRYLIRTELRASKTLQDAWERRLGAAEREKIKKDIETQSESIMIVRAHHLEEELDDQIRGTAFSLAVLPGSLKRYLVRIGITKPLETLDIAIQGSDKAMQELEKLKGDIEDNISTLLKERFKDDLERLENTSDD